MKMCRNIVMLTFATCLYYKQTVDFDFDFNEHLPDKVRTFIAKKDTI
jgi:hypothetical protein